MNKNQFIAYMETPEKISGADAILINEVIKQFPYFQTAQLLYAKGLHNSQHINYNSQLKTTAIYASDRKVLYRFITNKKNEEAVTVDEILLSTTATTIEENVERHSIDERKVINNEIQTPVLEQKEINVQSNTNTIEESAITEETTEENNISELEIDYLDHAATNVYSEKMLHELPEAEKNILQETKEKVDDISTPITPKQKEPESFTDWLTHLGDDTLSFSAYDINSIESEPTTANNKLSDFELIDKFIKEEPKISRPKAEFFNPVNMAKQSVTEDISFVSETLAKIYELQGNYNKALAAYESLRLKYPEKKLYFAAQIKHIKKLINQNNIK